MEIYQAASEAQESKDLWIIKEVTNESRTGRPMFIIERDIFKLPVGSLSGCMGENTYITKQRGGIRQFKTLDTAYVAMRQIGVSTIKLTWE